MGCTIRSAAAVAGLFVARAIPAFAEGDPERGESIFRQCSGCHAIGEDARKLTGPTLNGLPGASVAYDDEQRYSPALLALRDEGTVWTAENLDAFLASPRDFAPRNRISFTGVRDPQDRADVFAYIAQFADVQ